MIDLSGVKSWLVDSVIPITVIVVGLVIIYYAVKKDHRSATTMALIVVIGIVVVTVGSTTGAIQHIGHNVLATVHLA